MIDGGLHPCAGPASPVVVHLASERAFLGSRIAQLERLASRPPEAPLSFPAVSPTALERTRGT